MTREMVVERLTVANSVRARTLFTIIAQVFETTPEPLSDEYVLALLSRDDFWALSASIDGTIVGGLTAHTLQLTRAELREIFIYDVAVVPEYQRRGVGRALLETLRAQAAVLGITVLFVPADNEDVHALDFYHALGGVPAPVTIFTFSDDDP